MKRRLNVRILFPLFLLIFVNALIAGLLFQFIPDRVLIDLRCALFSKKAPANFSQNFYYSSNLASCGFKYPNKRYYSGKLNQMLNLSFADANCTFDSAKRIALALSAQPTKGHNNDQSENLLNCVSLVSQGFGRCSDYAQSFAATCLENNIMVREVSNMTHTFNEIYLPDKGKWVFIDAQYCLTACDNAGNLLSAMDILHAFSNHTAFKFSSFAPYQKFQAERNEAANFYEVNGNSDAYKFLVFTNGINVFQVNKWNQHLTKFPKPLRQFLLLSLGIQPGYLVYDPHNHIRPSLIIYRVAFVMIILPVALINYAVLRLPIIKIGSTEVDSKGIQVVSDPAYAQA